MAAPAPDRPNIVIFMADQLSALALRAYGGAAKTPALDRIAAEGAVFENAYCNYPLCAPSRFAFMSGQLPSRIGAYDNAAEFAASVPTFAHYLRAQGYDTCLSGKMHFIGPDQLHGFEERLTTDIYPADFGWTPSWELQRKRSSGENVGTESGVSGIETVIDAGPVARSMQLDYDEDVSHRAIRKIYDWARQPARRPLLLVVSFTQPHDPFVITREFWDLYRDDEIPPPKVGRGDLKQIDPQSERIAQVYGFNRAELTADAVRRARRGYYAMISFVDREIGEVRAAMAAAGMADNTVTMVCADHGEMLGERGMWFKKTFFEPAMRVPLMFHGPRIKPARLGQPVSLVDVLPTLVELAGGAPGQIVDPVDGQSLLGALSSGRQQPRDVLAEHFDGGVSAPRVMLRRGDRKIVVSPEFPTQLYDLTRDPLELDNLSGRDAAESELLAAVRKVWDMNQLAQDIEASQRRRLLLAHANAMGNPTSWDYAASDGGAERYVRRGHVFPDVERQGYLPYPRG
ncbi:MAG: choline-sulfatase [Alphaproteobacteria bacterium]|nr:choline-sulfatase [Alphaproteobacteria bacterium]